jgi:hypothetical protein
MDIHWDHHPPDLPPQFRPPVYCFGRIPTPTRHRRRNLKLGDYLAPDLPAPPSSSGNLARVYAALGSSDPTVLFPLDGNDVTGNCTIAGLAHWVTIINGFLGRKRIPSLEEINGLYFQLTGGADTGLDLGTVCRYIRANRWLGEDPILAFAEVNVRKPTQFCQALAYFGPLYSGIQVQANAIQDFEARVPWTPGDLTDGGHCIITADYAPDNDTELTWGNTELATPAWRAECLDEAYVLIPKEAAEPGYIPGFDSDRLLRDLAEVTA